MRIEKTIGNKTELYKGDIKPYDFIIDYCSKQRIIYGYFVQNNKDREFTRDRNICFYLLNKVCKISHKEISLLFNRDSHSTVTRGIEWVENEYENVKGFRNEFDLILARLCEEII